MIHGSTAVIDAGVTWISTEGSVRDRLERRVDPDTGRFQG